MKQTIYENDFIDAFKQSESRKEQFSYDALEWLYQYYTEIEEATGEEMELDIIAICCEWTEYEASELINDYSYLLEDEDSDEVAQMDEDEKAERIAELLEEETTVSDVGSSWLVMNF